MSVAESSVASTTVANARKVRLWGCSALGKNTTAGQIEDVVRERTGTTGNGTLTSQMVLDFINWNVEIGFRFLPKRWHLCQKNLGYSSTNSYDLSGTQIESIQKIVDSTNGEVEVKTALDFERLSSLDQYKNSEFAVQEGETLRVFIGANLTPGLVYLYYYRKPIYVGRRSDKPDLPDSMTDRLIESVVTDVQEFLKYGKPHVKEQDHGKS